MTARRLIAVFLAVFLSVVFSSFSYALWLLWRGPSRPAEEGLGRPAPLPPDVVALLERSADQMKNGAVEQALLGYRRVLTLGPSLRGAARPRRGRVASGTRGRGDSRVRAGAAPGPAERGGAAAPRPGLCRTKGNLATIGSPLPRVPGARSPPTRKRGAVSPASCPGAGTGPPPPRSTPARTCNPS